MSARWWSGSRLFFDRAAERVPPQTWFGVSAIFHYLGPSFAVLLFPVIGVLGVAWFRIASAALIFSTWTRPWKVIGRADRETRFLLLGLGVCLAVMNTSFYLALERLPMSLVAAMEFVGMMGVAAYGLRTRRNGLALLMAVVGVFVLIDVKWSTDPVGLFWSFLNSAMFVAYVILGHRAAAHGANGGIERLGAAMLVALVFLMPIGFRQALDSFSSVQLIAAGIGVGLCSSVIPYMTDQLAMSRLPRASFALMLALLPAVATIIAAIVLHQIPSPRDVLGVVLVMFGIAVHKPMVDPGDQQMRRSAPCGDAGVSA